IHSWFARTALLRLAIVRSHVHLVSDFLFGIEHVMRAGDGIINHHHGVGFASGRARTESSKRDFPTRAPLAVAIERARRGAMDDRAVWQRLRRLGRGSGRKWRALHYLPGMHAFESKQFDALAKLYRRPALSRHPRLQHEQRRRRWRSGFLRYRAADARCQGASYDQRSPKVTIHFFLLFSPVALQN